MTSKAPIGTRWIDINKGDTQNPKYRSRLVAKEYKVDIRPDLYAATPPTECLRLLLSRAAENENFKVLYVDVSRAYFYAKSVRPTYIKLPDEDPRSNEPGVVGKLMMSMYGTRDAAQNWAEEYSSTLAKAGYIRGVANPCLFHSKAEKCGVMVHGDDFVAVGDKKSTDRLKLILEKAYKITCEILGGDADEKDEIRVLNRVIHRSKVGYTLEADPRHAEIVIRDLGLENARPSRLPGSKEEHKRAAGGPAGAGVYPMLSMGEEFELVVDASDDPVILHKGGNIGKGKGVCSTDAAADANLVGASPQRGLIPGGVLGNQEGRTIASLGGGDPRAGLTKVVGGPGSLAAQEETEADETLLGPVEAKLFRGVAARLNYMGPDRPDMQYAIKESARCMANPRVCDWPLLKKLGRYLLHRPRLVLHYKWQKKQTCLDGYTDSDWGGCTRSRRSTSGAVIMVGRHVVKSYSKQQKVIALSSAEAETYGMVSCSAELLGIQACSADLGLTFDASVYADASAALGIVQRRGIGKVRHIRTQSLWLQEAHAQRRLGFEKIDGSRNPSDLMTKHLSDTLQQRHLDYMSAEAAAGRASSAPTLSTVEIDLDRYLYGIFGEDAPRSALKQDAGGIGKYLGIGSDAATGSEGANILSKRDIARRWRAVQFSPIVGVISITPYSELYGLHPREFDFDASGTLVKREVANPPSPHSREIMIRQRPECINILGNDRANKVLVGSGNIHFAPVGISSMEEECEIPPYRSGATDMHDRVRNTQEERGRQTMTRARIAAWAQVPTAHR